MDNGINKTIVVTYDEAKIIMDYTTALCGCCQYENFDRWYEKNEAYFVKKGMYIMEDLMSDIDGNTQKYCFTFNFENPLVTVFTIYNYYTQVEVCTFRYSREEKVDGQIPFVDVKMDEYKPMLWQGIGDFLNETIGDETKAVWETFKKKYANSSLKIYNKELKNTTRTVDKMVAQFMCEHTVFFCYATMFYFSVQRPDSIKIEEYEATNPKEIDLCLKSGKRKYYYSGYVNLNQTKIYRPRINEKLDSIKRGEYKRHIEKWGVRGHYRNVNGKQIWIDAHERGEGKLESRVYGTEKESEVNIIPQVFEVEYTYVEPTQTEQLTMPEEVINTQDDIVEQNQHIEEIVENKQLTETPVAIQKLSWFKRFILWIKSFINK
jgi:hypothetical protein